MPVDLRVILDDLRPGWMRDALCREYPGHWWFPEQGESNANAVEVCRRCAVRAECLAYAHAEHLDHGVWGATSARQRVADRRHGDGREDGREAA